MKTITRSFSIIILFCCCVNVAYGNLILFDQRIDAQQITEVRFTAPEGCVITGLGLRAHYDNITTMHCRYHRLTADGRLVDPKEAHFGSEPDHQCEAKVLLPDGWVAVGFGAAGEPEWDVTLVRIWGRKLNSDGTLGEIKAFNDGFKPDRGPEREVLLAEPDRILAGVGARFGSNDILGIYGCSRKLLNIDKKTRDQMCPFTTHGWIVNGFNIQRPEILTNDIKKYGVNRLDINLGSNIGDDQIHNIKALVAIGNAAGTETYLWTDATDTNSLNKLFEKVRDLTGIVVDVDAVEKHVLEICKKANRKLSIRIDPAHTANRRVVNNMPSDVSIIVSGNLSSIPDFGRHIVLAEIDMANRATVKADLPDVQLNDLASQLARAQISGANGFVVHINDKKLYVTDTVNSLGLMALHRLADDPFQSTDKLWDSLCSERYGKAGPLVKAALQHVASANNLIFGSLGIRFLWSQGRLSTVDAAQKRLQKWIKEGRNPQAIKILLAPTDKTMRPIDLEKETALWFIRQSVSAAEKATQIDPSAKTHLLSLAVQRSQQAAAFCKAATRCFMLTQLYAQDAALSTLESIEATIENLNKAKEQTISVMGDTVIYDGTEEFIESVKISMEKSTQNAPIAIAFSQAKAFAKEGRHEQAAQKLYTIINDENLAPHLLKNKFTVGGIASSLKSLWDCPDNLHSLWGGDGQWNMAKKSGRWAWASNPRLPCIYFDVTFGPLAEPADYILTFDYFDEGNFKIWVNYDSDYPGGVSERQFHPAEAVQLKNTNTWKTAERELTKCLFNNGQNENADFRFVGGKGKILYIRNISLMAK